MTLEEQIRSLTCAICGKPAVCVGRYEDMPEPGEPACGECCGHGCEDGECDQLYDEDGEITADVAWYDDNKQGTRMRARVRKILEPRRVAIDLLVRIVRVVVPLGAVAQLEEWGGRYANAVHEIRELHAVYSCECKPSTWCLHCQIEPHLEAVP